MNSNEQLYTSNSKIIYIEILHLKVIWLVTVLAQYRIDTKLCSGMTLFKI